IMALPSPRGAAASEGATAPGESTAATKAATAEAPTAPTAAPTAATATAQHAEKEPGQPAAARARGPAPAATHGAQHRQQNEDEDEEHQESGPTLVPHLPPLRRELVAAQHRENCVRTGGNAPCVVPAAEMWGYHVVNDQHALRVRERAFEAVADLDTHPLLTGIDDQQHAVVLALLADAPVTAELVAVILDGIAIERWQRDHHELRAVGLRVGRELL